MSYFPVDDDEVEKSRIQDTKEKEVPRTVCKLKRKKKDASVDIYIVI